MGTSISPDNISPVTTDLKPKVGHVIVAAHNEADRIADTVSALHEAFPGCVVVVADDGSTDATSRVAEDAGATVVRSEKNVGKGGAASLAAARLAGSAAKLAPLALAVQSGEADLTVAIFASRVGGGFGAALGFAHWAIERRCGLDTQAPISGQRALS